MGWAALAQVGPGGIGGARIWQTGEDQSSFIGNYSCIDLLDSSLAFQDFQLVTSEAITGYLVLMPKNDPAGEVFAKFGSAVVFDDHIELNHQRIEIDFNKGVPSILTLQLPPVNSYGWHSKRGLEVIDKTLFNLAELVVFSRVLSREEKRKVSSFLALKYSITITENKENDWRDYWTSEDLYYWDKGIDRMFNKRVLGLGRSDKEHFFQSQTVSTSGREIWFALNHMKSQGIMPAAQINDASFIVFSERDSTLFDGANCRGKQSESHPLERWKFKLKDWESEEEELWVKMRMPENIDPEDSLFLYSGAYRQFLPIASKQGEFWSYRILLQGLSPGVNYFFTRTSSEECLEQIIQFADNQLEVFNPQLEPWKLEIQSLESGLITSANVDRFNFTAVLGQGQQLVTVRNADEEPVAIQVVSGSTHGKEGGENSIHPELSLFPNPVESGQVSVLSAHDLPGKQAVSIVISDAAGRVIRNQTIEYVEELEYKVKLDAPGVYTLCVNQGDWAYTLKHIVSTSK